MLTAIVLGAVALIGAVLLYAASRPNEFRVRRSVAIKAEPDKIFALINDLNSWSAWSPYEKKDPAMKRILSGPAAGKGAVCEWDGNKEVGAGRMEIVDASSPSKVALILEFIRPFAGRSNVEFTLAPRDGATEVTWSISGPNTYMAKVISLFINCEKMISTDFDAGLASLKSAAEA